jgi:carbamoyltransferase
MKRIMGIRYGHDASVALLVDGKIVASVAEERFTRTKNDGSFPINAIEYCLKTAGMEAAELDAIVFPAKGYLPPPLFAFFAVPEEVVPLKKRGDVPVLPIYFKPWKLSKTCKLLTVEHHRAHAASAYYTSGLAPTERALVVTMDGRGDEISVAVWRGEKNRLTSLHQWDGSASLGWFYANATEALGWRHGSDEWKTMGLAPYGTPQPGALKGYHPEFENGKLVKGRNYGAASRWLDHGVNHYHMQDSIPLSKIAEKLGKEDYSAEVQRVAEEQAEKLILPWLEKENTRHFCAAGGFFLNVKFNQKLWYTGKLDSHWTYPDPGDAGLALGAALSVYFEAHPEQPAEKLPHMYYGPEYSAAEIESLLKERKLEYEKPANVSEAAARYLAENKIIAWFQGRMEAGPRALGNRSILMSPLRPENKDLINACVKYREAFRPFAPAMLYEAVDDYLINAREEPYMITSFEVKPEKQDKIPAVVHVDGTSRPQTVRRETNPRYYDLIKSFGELTGENVILNTSFNVKGEPIICHPREAIKCFFDTGLDVLVLGDFILKKPGV